MIQEKKQPPTQEIKIMKNYKLIYSSQEDCNCSNSHDTVIVEDYPTLKDALNNFYDLDVYEAHEHSTHKAVALQIEEKGKTKEHTLAVQDWNYTKQEWNDVENYEFDINQPDDEY